MFYRFFKKSSCLEILDFYVTCSTKTRIFVCARFDEIFLSKESKNFESLNTVSASLEVVSVERTTNNKKKPGLFSDHVATSGGTFALIATEPAQKYFLGRMKRERRKPR